MADVPYLDMSLLITILCNSKNICNKKTPLRKVVCIKNILKKHAVDTLEKCNNGFRVVMLKNLLIFTDKLDYHLEKNIKVYIQKD